MERKQLAVKSSFITLIAQLFASIISFISRKVTLVFLGIGILGIHSTLNEIMGMLSLTELGFAGAIMYRLYEPLAKDNYDVVSAIIAFIKKIYFYIGVIIVVIGLFMLPVLPLIIKIEEVENYSIVYIAYILLLFSSASTYFFAYGRTLINADRRIYIVSLIDMITNIVFSSIRIAIVVLINDYLLFVGVLILQNIFSNICIYIYCKKHYKWLSKRNELDKKVITDIIHDTKNVFIGKTAGYVFNSTDSMVISYVLGTTMVGLIGNYKSITVMMINLLNSIMAPIKSMLGNYLVLENMHDSEQLLRRYGFVRYSLGLIFLTPTFLLCSAFVKLWYGKDLVLNYSTVLLLVLCDYMMLVCAPVGEIADVKGKFKEQNFMYIIASILNLGISVFGALYWGINAVLIGTIMGMIFMWGYRSHICYVKCLGLAKKLFLYWIEQLIYVLVFAINISVCVLFFYKLLIDITIVKFLIIGVGSLVFSCVVWWMVAKRLNYYEYMIELIRKLLFKRR